MKFILAAICLISCLLCAISNGYAQTSVTELENNVNRYGKERTSKAIRITSEVGMGLAFGAIQAGVAAGIGAIANSYASSPNDERSDSSTFMFTSVLLFELFGPTMIAGGTFVGGKITGSRSDIWPAFVGSYVGATASYLFLIGFTDWGIATHFATLPVFSILGAVVGCELSEKKGTQELKKERNKLNMKTKKTRTFEFVPVLYSGTF